MQTLQIYKECHDITKVLCCGYHCATTKYKDLHVCHNHECMWSEGVTRNWITAIPWLTPLVYKQTSHSSWSISFAYSISCCICSNFLRFKWRLKVGDKDVNCIIIALQVFSQHRYTLLRNPFTIDLIFSTFNSLV